MKIGVISDTHGQVTYTRPAVDVFRQHDVDVVLHCGDIGSSQIVDLFADWPSHFVFGNVDYQADLLRSAMEAAGQTCHGEFGVYESQGRRIALLHGHDQHKLRETVSGGEFDLVCHGHTHVAKLERIGETLVLNPGAVYRAARHTVALVELPELDIAHVPLAAAEFTQPP